MSSQPGDGMLLLGATGNLPAAQQWQCWGVGCAQAGTQSAMYAHAMHCTAAIATSAATTMQHGANSLELAFAQRPLRRCVCKQNGCGWQGTCAQLLEHERLMHGATSFSRSGAQQATPSAVVTLLQHGAAVWTAAADDPSTGQWRHAAWSHGDDQGCFLLLGDGDGVHVTLQAALDGITVRPLTPADAAQGHAPAASGQRRCRLKSADSPADSDDGVQALCTHRGRAPSNDAGGAHKTAAQQESMNGEGAGDDTDGGVLREIGVACTTALGQQHDSVLAETGEEQPAPSAAAVDEDDGDDDMSPYERERLRTIARNRLFMQQWGLETARQAIDKAAKRRCCETAAKRRETSDTPPLTMTRRSQSKPRASAAAATDAPEVMPAPPTAPSTSTQTRHGASWQDWKRSQRASRRL